MLVAHYIPWRAIRAGKQLSDSKGASAALSTEAAIQCVHRAMAGFIGPKDIFRNPEALFRQFEPTGSHSHSPFDIVLSKSGDDFAVMGMHFKLGVYEHQSAGAIGGLIDMISENAAGILDGGNSDNIETIKITSYEPAYGIIGDPAKMKPTTR
jgi:2-methylcitrate dehydratase